MHPTTDFVKSFREATPYIHNYRNKTFVLVINGHTIQSKNFYYIAQDINLLASLGIRLILVHGARAQIDALLHAKGIAKMFHKDHRVTDYQTLEVVKQACGATRFEVEATLSMGMPSSPMNGAGLKIASGNFITARPLGIIDGIDMQNTGRIRKIDTHSIEQKLDDGCLVLVSPIGYSLTGEAFKLSPEDVASNIAISLKAEKLIYMVNGRGAVDSKNKHIQTLTAHDVPLLLESTPQTDDVTRALTPALTAIKEGINRVHLLSDEEDGSLLSELFTRNGTGTMITRDPLVKIREAHINDIAAIISLIRPLEESGVLVKRSLEHLEMHIHEYSVLVHDTQIYGCVAMHILENTEMAELACLAVAPHKQDLGLGEQLLQHVLSQARVNHIKKLFALTTQTAHWFLERGFEVTELTELPMTRQKLYNYQRRSKIFVKNL